MTFVSQIASTMALGSKPLGVASAPRRLAAASAWSTNLHPPSARPSGNSSQCGHQAPSVATALSDRTIVGSRARRPAEDRAAASRRLVYFLSAKVSSLPALAPVIRTQSINCFSCAGAFLVLIKASACSTATCACW